MATLQPRLILEAAESLIEAAQSSPAKASPAISSQRCASFQPFLERTSTPRPDNDLCPGPRQANMSQGFRQPCIDTMLINFKAIRTQFGLQLPLRTYLNPYSSFAALSAPLAFYYPGVLPNRGRVGRPRWHLVRTYHHRTAEVIEEHHEADDGNLLHDRYHNDMKRAC